MNRRRFFSLLVFILGFLVFVYPLILRTYHDYQYRVEVAEIEDEFSEVSSLKEYERQLSYNMSDSQEDIGDVSVGFATEDMAFEDFDDERLLGTISIPKIDLNYPIYDGATDENLYRGVARIEGTGYPVGGENKHSVIAGHNGLVGQTYFSELTKLENGDVIEVRNAKEDLLYEVYQTDVIEPTDVEALRVIPEQDTLTLLTCTYPPPGTHRYLVFAKRVLAEGEAEEAIDVSQMKEAGFLDHMSLFFVRYGQVILMVLFAGFGGYLFFIRKSRRNSE